MLLWMSAACPPFALLVEHGIPLVNPLGSAYGWVMCPARDEWGEPSDAIRLWRGAHGPYDLREGLSVGLLRCRAGQDDGAEMLDAVWSDAVSGPSVLVLPEVDAEAVNTWRAQFLCQGVGDAGCGVCECSSHLCQPCFGHVLCFLYGSEVLVNDEEVIRIPDDLWCPLAASCLTDSFLGVGVDPWLSWECRFNGGLEAMEGNIGAEWGQDPYKVANILVGFSTSIPQTQLRPG